MWTVIYQVAERFHWTLDYVESLDPGEFQRLTAYVAGVEQGQAEARKAGG